MPQRIQARCVLNISMQITQKCVLLMLCSKRTQIYKRQFLNKVESYNYPYNKKIIILNCRSDRIDRTQLFVEDFLEDVDYDVLICTGKSTQLVSNLMQKCQKRNI